MKKSFLLLTFSFLLIVSGVSAQDFTMPADELYQAYDENEVAADMKFKGKIVVITGEIQDIGKDLLDNAYIVIGGEGFLDGVQCFFKKSNEGIIAKLKKKQSVTVKGKVTGMLGFVHVENCEIELKQNKEAKKQWSFFGVRYTSPESMEAPIFRWALDEKKTVKETKKSKMEIHYCTDNNNGNDRLVTIEIIDKSKKEQTPGSIQLVLVRHQMFSNKNKVELDEFYIDKHFYGTGKYSNSFILVSEDDPILKVDITKYLK